MKRTLMVSVAALALAAGSTIAMSQGGGGGGRGGDGGGAGMGAGGAAGGGAGAPMNSPAGAGASGGAAGTVNESPAPGRGAQDRAIPEKQQKAQQAPSGTQAPTTRQTQGERDKSAPTTKQSQDAQPPAQQRQQQTQQPSTGGSKQGAGTPGTAGAQGGAMRSSNVSLTTEQKTTIRSKVLVGSAPRVTNVNFDIRVGTVVPRTVRIAPVPVALIEIEPTWRGFMYFVSGDTIIVVEPRTLEIVAVLEV